MADVAFFPSRMAWPNPAEAALKWVELAQKGAQTWTAASLDVLRTYSAVMQTQRETLAALVPSVALKPPTPAETKTAAEEVIEAALEAMPAPVLVIEAMEEIADAAVAGFPTPAPAAVEEAIEAVVEAPPAPAPKDVAAPPPIPAPAARTMKTAEPSVPAKAAKKTGEAAVKIAPAGKAAKKAG